MEKQEFIKRMGLVISSIVHSCQPRLMYTCSLISTAFGQLAYERYAASLNHLPRVECMFIKWGELGVDVNSEDAGFQKIRELKIGWLEDFKEACLKDKFYEEL